MALFFESVSCLNIAYTRLPLTNVVNNLPKMMLKKHVSNCSQGGD